MRNLLALFLLVTLGWAGESDKKMNVLFIVSDDMNNDLGTYGHPFVKSPNLDKLASRGVQFDRAYCQFPWCAPSRASFMTGLRPDTTKVMDLTYHFRQGLPNVVTLPQAFMKAGYFAARVGKVYHYGNPGDIGTSGADDPASWNQVVNPAGRDKTALENDILIYPPTTGLGSSMSLLADRTGKDEEHTDGKVATEAIKLMETNKDKPFFLAVGFYKPHCPWVAPQKWFDMYKLEDEVLPPIAPNWKSTVPTAAYDTGAEWPYRGVTPAQAQECRRAYHATISYVDSQIGRVVEALDRLGLAKTTIIVFISDHGYHLGEHGLWMKQTCFEEAARIPLFIVDPRASANGKISKRTVELVDLYPTLTDLAGVKAPEGLEGVSLRPLLENPDAQWSRAAYTQTVTKGKDKVQGYSVRTERWRFTEWQNGEKGMELYDHDADPQELKNLASDSAYASTITELKALSKKMHPVMVAPGKAEKKSGEGKKGE
jgi:iduronate 2-sulfatase